jgi:transketolase
MEQLLERLRGDEKHDWSSASTFDVLWVLYDRVLGDDDRFLLSKGHGPMAYYAVLAAKGLIDEEELDGFGSFDSRLGYHPDRVVLPAAEISSGSLGHGLPIAVGVALTGRRTFVLVGDGELDEGSNWEAVQLAGRLRLAGLTAIVVDNASATHGWPSGGAGGAAVYRPDAGGFAAGVSSRGIAQRFDLEGWDAVTVDGRDRDALEDALTAATTLPRCVVAEVRS